jgi:hypothetical protein
MADRQKISFELDDLFPGGTVSIGKSIILIRPLNIEQIAVLSKKIKAIGSLLSKEGITWENYSEKTSLLKIAVVLLDSFPDVLEEASNIDINDLKKLPLNSIVLIVSKVIEVNLKSKDDLIKNFTSLIEKLAQQIQMQETTPIIKKFPVSKNKK